MRKFLKRSWHGIPIGIIASVLICTVVVAGTYLTVTQVITQKIVGPSPPPDYGEIIAPSIALPNLETGKSFSKTVEGGVTVNLEPDGVGEALRLACDADEKYTSFDVTITLTTRPASSTVGGPGPLFYGWGISAGGEVAIDLDVEGTYIFDQTIEGRAGSETGAATSTITLTLEESSTPAR